MIENKNLNVEPQDLVNSMLVLYRLGKFEDILIRSKKIIRAYPNSPNIHNLRGLIYANKKLSNLAIKHFKKSIDLLPNNPVPYSNLGSTLIDTQNFKQAIKTIKIAIKLKPEFYEAFNNLGNAYTQLNKYKIAFKNYKRAIEINPNYYEAYDNLIKILKINKDTTPQWNAEVSKFIFHLLITSHLETLKKFPN